jgi:Phage tail sheath protein subtilisin-like domain
VTLPGVQVLSRAQPPSRGITTDVGAWFVVGAAEKGPTTYAQLVRNMTEFTLYFGSRQSYSILWDALETFFREGGSRAYVVRVAGASAVNATKTINDGQGTPQASLKIDAKNAGAWGNSLSVATVLGNTGSERVLVITHSTLGEVDRSPSLADQAAAVSWSRSSDWVNVSIPGGASTNLPAVAAAAALTTGADDNSGITDNQRQAALAYFTRDLGPGQVSIPGNTTTANLQALVAHARAYNRQALVDGTDTASRSTLVTQSEALQGDEYGAIFAPWVLIPGLVGKTSRTVPPSALVAGLMARSDATQSPNVAAAGDNGRARYALGLSQVAWTDADRELLNNDQVNVFRQIAGQVTLYGYRTLANPNGDISWQWLSNQRLRLKITAEAEKVAEGFLFDQIDGKGQKIAEFAGALGAVLLGYYNDGALYGETPEDAYSVDVGESVNTPTTLSAGELRAVLTMRMSPLAEIVRIEIVKVPLGQPI